MNFINISKTTKFNEIHKYYAQIRHLPDEIIHQILYMTKQYVHIQWT